MKKNVVRLLGIFLLIIFFALIIMNYTGFYEYRVSKKTALTNENIEKFEKDIEEGKDVEVSDYLEEDKDNSNGISDLTFKTSQTIGTVFNKMITFLFKSIEKTMTE